MVLKEDNRLALETLEVKDKVIHVKSSRIFVHDISTLTQ